MLCNYKVKFSKDNFKIKDKILNKYNNRFLNNNYRKYQINNNK